MVHVNNCCYFAGYLLKFDHGNIRACTFLPEQMFLLRVLFGSFVDLEGGISGGCRTGNRFKEGVFAAAGNEDLVFRGRHAFLLGTRGSGTNYSEVGGKLFVCYRDGANHRVESRRSGAGKRINRTHSARQAMDGIALAAGMGFDNISMDLIIGLPGQTDEGLLGDVEKASSLPIAHLSVYMLSIDSNTVFEHMVRRGEFRLEDEEVMAGRYQRVCERLKELDFEHYEISNFARNGKYSRHNTSYWQQKPYIGFGPSAHSYDLYSRQWNTANLKTYIDHLNEGALSFEKEELKPVDLYNEYVMTSLRTMWGMEKQKLEGDYAMFWEQVQEQVRKYERSGDLVEEGGRWKISETGWVISDAILSDLFVV